MQSRRVVFFYSLIKEEVKKKMFLATVAVVGFMAATAFAHMGGGMGGGQGQQGQ